MDQLLLNTGFPILSVLIFLPLVGALLLLFTKNDTICKNIALLVTSLVAIISIWLIFGFDKSSAQFQFGEHYNWINTLNINYTIGVDGISILLILMTTFIMPFCVLASWSYIKTGTTTASNKITTSTSASNEVSTSSTTSASMEITTASTTTNKSAI